jgi:ubiquinone/menaquinone biosynthesis C-methylase UbiE
MAAGARVVGLELSFPMLMRAGEKLMGSPFSMVLGDMKRLPFKDHSFDKSMSITAIEFIKDARCAVDELFRVTRPGGLIVVATLNRLSPWATRRQRSGKEGHALFQDVVFRSPKDMERLSSVGGICRTAIHFQKEEDPERAVEIEHEGGSHGLDTGAFLACCWQKP